MNAQVPGARPAADDAAPRQPGIHRRGTGWQVADQEVTEHTLVTDQGVSLSVLDLGGIVTAFRVPDRDGHVGNVVMGPARLADHLGRARHFSSLVGRYAGRIHHGRFVLEGQPVQLATNEGPNTLHGGPEGLDSRLWTARAVAAGRGAWALELSLVSADGDQGFPGRLEVTVRYTLAPPAEWRIDYSARTDRTTVVNLTHHVYWNLAGRGSIEDHRLQLNARHCAALDEAMIPQQRMPVAGTPLDFHALRRIGDGLRASHAQIRLGRGYDHFFVLDRTRPGLEAAARLEDPASGRTLDIDTTAPGVQFYSGNFLDGTLEGRHGELLRQGDGLCLETQHIGNAPNRADDPGTVLRPGQDWTSTTVHRLRLLPR
jgi:aldose 1-epimerase